MGVSIVVIMVSIGTIIGAVAGYFGGKIEMVLMRLGRYYVIPSQALC